MNEFSLELATEEINFDICADAGQVFRWRKLSPNQWLGVDGGAWYLIQESGTKISVKSNRDKSAFERLFRLDQPNIVNELSLIGPELADSMLALKGLRLMRPESTVETFFSFLCTPNNHILRITAMVNKLGDLGEKRAIENGISFNAFPSLEIIANISELELRAEGFGYRATNIPVAAQRILEKGGTEYLDSLKLIGYENAIKELTTFRGIGPKLADCITLFALDYTEAAPLDTHLYQAVVSCYFPEWHGKPLTDLKYREAGDFMRNRFGKLAGFAHQFLYFHHMTQPKMIKTDKIKK